jgi:hypothetical protein
MSSEGEGVIELFTPEELRNAAVIVIQMDRLTGMTADILMAELQESGFSGSLVCLQPGETFQVLGFGNESHE